MAPIHRPAAIKWINGLEKFDLQYVEQPVPDFDLAGMAQVRRCCIPSAPCACPPTQQPHNPCLVLFRPSSPSPALPPDFPTRHADALLSNSRATVLIGVVSSSDMQAAFFGFQGPF